MAALRRKIPSIRLIGSPSMSNSRPIRIRVLSASDLHQSQLHYEELARAVSKHRPNVVALVGDVLNAVGSFGRSELSISKCAELLAALPVVHLVFVRGNHEDFTWTEFVAAWPHERRPLTALYGTACSIGPLVIVGFPCMTGSESHWCAQLSASNNTMELFPRKPRQQLPSDFQTWLPGLMKKSGPGGRVLWLMHEPPVGLPVADPRLFNPIWTTAIEQFGPVLAIAGHDHNTPLQNGTWRASVGKTMCLNVGQSTNQLHYVVLDFEFSEVSPSVPVQIGVRAFPWNQTADIRPTFPDQSSP